MTMDTINGWFEIGGAFVTLLSVRQLLRDRVMRGFHWGPTIFFTAWGVWNLAYYPHLHQPVSTVGAGLLVLVNALYLALMLRFRRHRWVSHPTDDMRLEFSVGRDEIGPDWRRVERTLVPGADGVYREIEPEVLQRTRDAMDHR